MKVRATILLTALALGGCDDDGTNPPGTTQTGNPNTVPGAIADGGALPGQPAADASAPAPGGDAAQDAASPPLDAAPAALDGAGLGSDAAGSGSDAAPSDAGSSDAASSDGAAPTPGAGCLKPGGGDYTKPGPYKFKQKDVTIGAQGRYTIVYPDPLEASCPHPFVAWGNGTFITGGDPYAHFNEHAASWGIVSIASHSSSVGDGSFHKAAIDYLLAQNKESGSEFFGKLSDRAGVSGHSQGGAGADRSADHPNVKAIANVQGSFGTPPQSSAAFLCLTGTDDIQPTGCPMAVKAAKVPALCASYQGADHVATTLFEGTGIDQYKRLYSAWFRCFLADDAQACALFKGGASCPVCKESGWAEIFANNY